MGGVISGEVSVEECLIVLYSPLDAVSRMVVEPTPAPASIRDPPLKTDADDSAAAEFRAGAACGSDRRHRLYWPASRPGAGACGLAGAAVAAPRAGRSAMAGLATGGGGRRAWTACGAVASGRGRRCDHSRRWPDQGGTTFAVLPHQSRRDRVAGADRRKRGARCAFPARLQSRGA